MKTSAFFVLPGLFLYSLISCTHTGLPATQLGNWLASAPIGDPPRGYASVFVIGTDAYVGCGYNQSVGGTGRLKDFWRFNVDSGWAQVADFAGAPRSEAAAFSVGSYGYVGTGYDLVNVYSDFYQYDPVQNVWTRKADFPGTPRYDAVGFGVRGKGYIGTGYNINWFNDFYEYDPAQDKWSVTPGTSGDFQKRQGAVAFVYKDQAYIVTGVNSGGMVRDFWRFDPAQSPAWHQLANITNTDQGTFDDGYTDIERSFATAFVNGDQAYLTTGANVSNINSTWAYDFASDRWSRRTPWQRASRSGAISFTVSARSFVGTGNSGTNGTFDEFDEFQPTQAFNSNDY
ncbi:MAG TPA: kelch repeat-containing protein [Puia sp.]|nr:kelch repeat-containing protein [Puia sp.]